jgi:hypothetical protein
MHYHSDVRLDVVRLRGAQAQRLEQYNASEFALNHLGM